MKKWLFWRKIYSWYQKWHEEFVKFSCDMPIYLKTCALMCYFCQKHIMFEPKKIQKSYVSQHRKMMQNLKSKWLVLWKMTWEIWWISTEHAKILKLPLWGTFLYKVFNGELKKLERSYVSWQCRVMQYLQTNWLVVS